MKEAKSSYSTERHKIGKENNCHFVKCCYIHERRWGISWVSTLASTFASIHRLSWCLHTLLLPAIELFLIPPLHCPFDCFSKCLFILIYLVDKETEGIGEEEKKSEMWGYLPSTASLTKCSEQVHPGQAEVRNQNLHACVSHGWQHM